MIKSRMTLKNYLPSAQNYKKNSLEEWVFVKLALKTALLYRECSCSTSDCFFRDFAHWVSVPIYINISTQQMHTQLTLVCSRISLSVRSRFVASSFSIHFQELTKKTVKEESRRRALEDSLLWPVFHFHILCNSWGKRSYLLF